MQIPYQLRRRGVKWTGAGGRPICEQPKDEDLNAHLVLFASFSSKITSLETREGVTFVIFIASNFSLRLGRCHFLFSCDTVWAVCFAGSAAVLLDRTFTFQPRNAMELA